MLDKTFTGTIYTDADNGGWKAVKWPEASSFFGTGKPVKVIAVIDGHEFQATFLPLGNGVHMLPLRAAVLKAIKKGVGDTVDVQLKERL